MTHEDKLVNSLITAVKEYKKDTGIYCEVKIFGDVPGQTTKGEINGEPFLIKRHATALGSVIIETLNE